MLLCQLLTSLPLPCLCALGSASAVGHLSVLGVLFPGGGMRLQRCLPSHTPFCAAALPGSRRVQSLLALVALASRWVCRLALHQQNRASTTTKEIWRLRQSRCEKSKPHERLMMRLRVGEGQRQRLRETERHSENVKKRDRERKRETQGHTPTPVSPAWASADTPFEAEQTSQAPRTPFLTQ